MSKDIKKPIILIGLMGAGKTTVGQALATELKVKFFDADQVIIEQESKSIAEIFAQDGESYFREVETKTILSLIEEYNNAVISVGGGAFVNEKTRSIIQQYATSVFLDADIEELKRRVGKGEGRPLLEGVDVGKKLASLKAVRDPIYKQADFTVMTQNEGVEDTVSRVLKALYKNNGLS